MASGQHADLPRGETLLPRLYVPGDGTRGSRTRRQRARVPLKANDQERDSKHGGQDVPRSLPDGSLGHLIPLRESLGRAPITIQRRHSRQATRHRLVRPVAKPFEASRLISRQPAMHRAPIHSPLESHVGYGPTLADARQHCLVPLLSHAHVPHGRDCDQSAEAVATSQSKVCDTSAEALRRRVNRTSTSQRADGEIRTPGQRFTKPLLYH